MVRVVSPVRCENILQENSEMWQRGQETIKGLNEDKCNTSGLLMFKHYFILKVWSCSSHFILTVCSLYVNRKHFKGQRVVLKTEEELSLCCPLLADQLHHTEHFNDSQQLKKLSSWNKWPVELDKVHNASTWVRVQILVVIYYSTTSNSCSVIFVLELKYWSTYF